MSGFAAILSFGAPVAPADVERLLAAAAYRGPDGTTVWTSGAVGLGYLSRRTLPDRDLVAQPLVVGDGDLAIVFDGRIDNRDDLAARLGGPRPDAALALEAYRTWGSAAAAQIAGDFAMVVWDHSRSALYCARDPLGIKPFYYHASAREFVCASDLGQILAAPGVTIAPNEGMIAEYLSNAIIDRHETVYASICRLPAAHWLEARAGVSIVPRRYWRIDPHRTIQYRRDSEYGDHFRSVFMTAVRDRLRSPAPVGVYFSGGTDSSAVIAAACAVADPASRPAGFTLAFDRPEQDERMFVDDLARFCGFESHVEPAASPGWTPSARGRDVHDFLRDRSADLWKRGIAERGCRVMLSGHGGDAGFFGSEYHYADLLRTGRLLQLMRQMRADRHMPDTDWSPSSLIKFGLWPLLPSPVHRLLRPLARRSIGYDVTRAWLEPAFTARVDLEARLRPAVRDARGPSAARDDLVRDIESGWNAVYRENAERDAEAQGLEDRHPFFDRRVVEFAAALPDDQRWRGTTTRYVVRNALGDLLSPASRARTSRAEGGARVAEAVRAMEALGLFDRMALGDAGWVKPDVLRGMYDRMMRRYGIGDPSYCEDAFPLWIVGGTESWFRYAFASGYNSGTTRPSGMGVDYGHQGS